MKFILTALAKMIVVFCFAKKLFCNMSPVADVKRVSDLEPSLSEIQILWNEVAPIIIQEWLDTYAKSHGTSCDLLLAGMLSAKRSLIGNATIKLFELWREKGNLFFVGLAPSGAGKTPACNVGWVLPTISHLELRIGQNILVYETSSNGLFNHSVNFHKGAAGESAPILCIDEGYTFLNKLTSTLKSVAETSLTMELMCKLYDGDYWYSVKGGKGKRVGVPSARMSMVTFTTPRHVLTEIWPKVIGCRNGLADTILILYQDRCKVEMEEMEQCLAAIQESSLKGFGTIDEHIFTKHHQESLNTPKVCAHSFMSWAS